MENLTPNLILAILLLTIVTGILLVAGYIELKNKLDQVIEELGDHIPAQAEVTSLITNNEAMNLIKNHQDKAFDGISNSVFISWQDIASYLAYVSDGMSNAGKQISGIEFYFGAYGDKGSNSTLVAYPTYQDGGRIPYDFTLDKNVAEMYQAYINGNADFPNIGAAANRMGQSPPMMPDTLGN